MDEIFTKKMTTVFCSNKLEKFLGIIEHNPVPDDRNGLGNWNGHLFVVERKKNLLFMNDKTAYTFVLLDIKKAEVRTFDDLFRDSLVSQLFHDLRINERQEIEVRKCVSEIQLAKTNNNKKVLGTMNDFIQNIKAIAYQRGGLPQLHNLSIGNNLNDYLIGTRLEAAKKPYSVPKELMRDLLTTLSK